MDRFLVGGEWRIAEFSAHSRRAAFNPTVPPHENRTPEEIVWYDRTFESTWHFWQALSWIDYAKRKTNIAALQYAALELRSGIEQLWYEIYYYGCRRQAGRTRVFALQGQFDDNVQDS
jgi:hypothetical protein